MVSKVAFTIAAVVNVNDWRGTDTGAMHAHHPHYAPHVTRASIIGQIDVMIGCHSIHARKQWRPHVINRTWATLTRERIMSQFHLLTTTGVLSSLLHRRWCQWRLLTTSPEVAAAAASDNLHVLSCSLWDRVLPVFTQVVADIVWLVSIVVFSCRMVFNLWHLRYRPIHRSSLRRLMCPVQDLFFWYLLLVSFMPFVLFLTEMLVLLSLYVMLIILLSSNCVMCLFGQCPGLCTICHSWQHTGVVHLSRQADGKVDFEEIPVFCGCKKWQVITLYDLSPTPCH